ncbi:MAG: hypothetical protein IIY60_04680 [Clostridia bacterium]|nr:hypothetical protein [Clostridia bacterium]
MSHFVQVGVSAMRDPVTGKMLNSVPLYVECEHIDQMQTIDVKQMARDLVKFMKKEAEENGDGAVSDV